LTGNVLEVEGKAGSLFVCIEGFKVDGHKFIPQAMGPELFWFKKMLTFPMTRFFKRKD